MHFIAFRSNDDVLDAEALPAPSEYQAFYPVLSELRKSMWRGRKSAHFASYSRPLGHLGRYQRHPDRTSLTSKSTQLSCLESSPHSSGLLSTVLNLTYLISPANSEVPREKDLLHNLFFLFLGRAS